MSFWEVSEIYQDYTNPRLEKLENTWLILWLTKRVIDNDRFGHTECLFVGTASCLFCGFMVDMKLNELSET